MMRTSGRTSTPHLSVTVVALVTLAWVVLLLSSTAEPRQAQLVSNVGLVASALAAGVAAIRRSRLGEGAMRRFWFLIGAAAGSWGCGQAVWTWYESILGREVPFPSPADIGYLGMPVLATAALLSLPLAAPTLAGRARTILDGLTVAASLLVCSWVLVLEPVFRAGSEGRLLEQAISLAYPVGDIVLITIVIYTALQVRHHGASQSVSLPLVGTGLVAFAVADSGFSYLTAVGAYSSGNGIDIGWFIGYALILVAALRPSRQVDVAEADEDARLAARPLGALFPSTAVILALLTTGVEILRTGQTDMFVSWMRSLIMVLLVTRQVLTLRENRYLTQHLEQRVDERTSELAASRARFAALVQHSSDVVTVVDADARIQYQSASSERLLGFQPSQIEGTSLCDLMTPELATDFLEALAHVATEPLGVHSMRSTWQHSDGGRRDVELTITNLLDNPHVRGLVLNSRDVTDRTTLEAELLHQAFHDSLTGLANRALFRDRLEHALAREGSAGGGVAIMFLDLDGFKEINDTLGHSTGDELLVLVAEPAAPGAQGPGHRGPVRRRRVRHPARRLTGRADARRAHRGRAPAAVRLRLAPGARLGQHRHRSQRRDRRDHGRAAAAQRRPGDVPGQGGAARPAFVVYNPDDAREPGGAPPDGVRSPVGAGERRVHRPLPAADRPEDRADPGSRRPWSAGCTRSAGWSVPTGSSRSPSPPG